MFVCLLCIYLFISVNNTRVSFFLIFTTGIYIPTHIHTKTKCIKLHTYTVCIAEYSNVLFTFLSKFVTDIISANKQDLVLLQYGNCIYKNKSVLHHFRLAGPLLWKCRWTELLLELLKGWSHVKHNLRLADSEWAHLFIVFSLCV